MNPDSPLEALEKLEADPRAARIFEFGITESLSLQVVRAVREIHPRFSGGPPTQHAWWEVQGHDRDEIRHEIWKLGPTWDAPTQSFVSHPRRPWGLFMIAGGILGLVLTAAWFVRDRWRRRYTIEPA
jgi:hypothetical protein